jgi:thioredoxin-related protein
MRKLIFILLIFSCAIPSVFAQLKSHSFEEVEVLNRKNPKPTLIFIHTSWCKYCKIMEKSTFQNPEVVQILNEKFYFILLDAESKQDIAFNHHIFKFNPNGLNTGVHELAVELATINKEIVYPAIAVLDSNFSIVFQKNAVLNVKELLFILQNIK